MEGHVISQLAGELVEQFEANQARRFCEGERPWACGLGRAPRHGLKVTDLRKHMEIKNRMVER